jgi:hypothetical protein
MTTTPSPTDSGPDPAFAASQSSHSSVSSPSGLQSGVLAQLAERCEAATGPDRELDWAIYKAIGSPPEPILGGSSISGQQWYAKAFTASIDAALTLVPEGWWIATLGQNLHGELTHCTLYNDFPVPLADCKRAATPALAICAAALRARSAQ